MMDLTIDGSEVRTNLGQLARRFPQLAAGALYQEALVEQEESMRRTPVDTGTLRASHRTSDPEVTPSDITVRIEVGGPAAPYALIVHEDLEADHPVGQAKFLESTLNESSKFFASRIAKRIEESL